MRQSSYDSWKLATPPWYDADHYEQCPCHEDAEPTYGLCGGFGKCECFPATLWGRLSLWYYGACEVNDDPPCKCETLKANDDAEYSDEMERRRDR